MARVGDTRQANGMTEEITDINSGGKLLGYAWVVKTSTMAALVKQFGEDNVVKYAIRQVNADRSNQARVRGLAKISGKTTTSKPQAELGNAVEL